ncbi:amino acid adenylation domain-containing protein [Gordonia sp. L191]|uniref:non-ribosomal peptide synthetase n=1 Tax=Gordonia sp. L191 TaxID=2982699 RepID=UPI0024BF2763|nr:non-ribosomal peptide synthetase [Gordonia sp. L191]WHU45887.1 amino acid adenylation domain-containing protein [Gordonia sp. L191]
MTEKIQVTELTAAQRFFWLRQQAMPSVPLNMAQVTDIEGPLDRDHFLTELAEQGRRARVMQLRFEEGPRGPVCIYDPSLHDHVEYVDVGDRPDPHGAVQEIIDADLHRAVDVTADRLARAILFRLSDHRHQLYNRAHHLTTDGVATRDNLVCALRRCLSRDPSAPSVPIADLSAAPAADDAYRISSRRARDADYWREVLAGRDPATSPAHRSGGPASHNHTVAAPIPMATMDAIRELITAMPTSLPTLIVTAAAGYLSRRTGDADGALTFAVAARTTAALRATPLPTINFVPLRAGVGRRTEIHAAVRTTERAMLGALRHQRYRFEDIVTEHGDHSGGPVLNLMLFDREMRFGETTVRFSSVTTGPAEDLAINVFPSGTLAESTDTGTFVVEIEANPRRYDPAEVTAFHDGLLAMLGALADALTAPGSARVIIDDLPLPARTPGVLGTESPTDTLPDLIAATVARAGNDVAVDGSLLGEPAVTFADLDGRTADLAPRLSALGARPGTRVVVLMRRGVDQVVAWWAVARSGATIVLIDPAQPTARIDRMLATAAPVLLLATSPEHGARAGIPSLSLDDLADVDPRAGRLPAPHPFDAAYVVFTSGSTGEPKGVVVPHTGPAVIARDMWARFGAGDGIDVGARWLAVASPMFDMAHFEMLACAALGHTLIPAAGLDADLGRALLDHRITHLMATPTVLNRIPLHTLPRTVSAIGEALSPALAARITCRPPGASGERRVFNTYGPAEATLYATAAPITADVHLDRPVPIGRPVPGMAALVLDHRLRPVADGIIGELYLCGPQLAHGYRDRPGLTATRFLACPWRDGSRMYRTGDLARRDPTTGDLVFVGRSDGQLSVRGVRVEPAEIENAATEVDGVGAAVVVADHAPDGDLALDVACVGTGAAPGGDGLERAVRAHLIATLPSVMWPRRVLMLDRLPTGPTGKIDRDAVARTVAGIALHEPEFVAATSDVECALGEIVADVIRVERVSMAASVIDLGGTSLTMLEIMARLGARVGRPLRIGELTPATTLAEIATRVGAGDLTAATAPATAPVVTPAQHQIWALNRSNPADHVYHLAVQVEFALGTGTEPVSADLVTADLVTADLVTSALTDLALHHDALRRVFPARPDGTPTMRLLPTQAMVDAMPITREALSSSMVRSVVAAPFDLTVDPPWRAVLDDSRGSVSMVFVVHHIAVDGWSIPILVRDMLIAVTARTRHRLPEFPGPGDFGGARPAADSDAGHSYWRDVLAGAPTRLALPEARAAGEVSTEAVHLERVVDARLSAAATAQATGAGATLQALVRVAVAAVLAGVVSDDDVVISVPTSGRWSSSDLERVGMFVRTVPVRAHAVASQTVAEALAGSVAALQAGMRHADTAPAQLADVVLAQANTMDGAELGRDTGLSRRALIRSATPIRTGRARTALEFVVDDSGEQLRLALTVAPDRVDPDGAGILLDHVVDTLTRLALADPTTLVGSCTPTGRGVAPQCPVAGTDPIHALLAHVGATPHAIAVTDARTSMTYEQLSTRAFEMAMDLRRVGVRAGDRVALLLGRSAETVVAMVGTLMADAAYVPLDPEHPPARTAELVAATSPAAIVGDGLLIEPGPGLGTAPRRPGIAYIIHTSGSTGRPKGVAVSRTALAAMLGAALDVIDATPADVWSATHSHTFDFSVWEIFGALCSGGRVVIVDRPVSRDPVLLSAILNDCGVSILSQTPTAFARLAAPDGPGSSSSSGSRLPALRCVVFGGEALQAPALYDWAQANPRVRLINMYGITETTVHLTATDVDTNDARSLIGAPFAGVGWSVRDRHLRPVPVGGLGELYVSGAQVADGYLHAPELTASRFVADPDGFGTRMYRTGDVVRLIAPDRLAYLGRSDDQMQVRGHRVEPAEIAAALVEAPGVREARVVIAGGTQSGDEHILAFVIDDDTIGAEVPVGERETFLLRACATRLPGYLMPARIGVVERWPLTDNGKLDRQALIAGLPAVTGTAIPLTVAQRRVADLVAEIVGQPGPQGTGRGPHDGGPEQWGPEQWGPEQWGPEHWGPDVNFFSVGGNSLSAARLAARLSGPGTQVTVADILAAPTIRGLTELVGADAHTSQVRPRDVLWPAQRVLWDAHRGQPDSAAYHLALRLTVRAEVPVVRAALLDLADRHPMLRAVFPDRGDTTPEVVILHADALTGNPPITQRDTVPDTGQAAEIVNAPFDLTTRPAWRAVLADSPAGTGIVLVAHHIAVDGASVPILLDDLHTALTARLRGRSPRWPEQPDELQVSVCDDDTDYWRTVLDGAAEHLALPEPPRRHPAAEKPAVVHERRINADTAAAINEVVAGAGTTLYSALWVALAATLAAVTDSDDVVAAIPVALPGGPRVGMRATTVPLRWSAVTADRRPVVALPIDEALVHAHRTIADAATHAASAPATLPDVLLDHAAALPDSPGPLITDITPINVGITRTALEFTVRTVDEGALSVQVTASPARVDVAAVEPMLEYFVAALTALTDSSTRCVAECLPAGVLAQPTAVHPNVSAQSIDPVDAVRAMATRQPDAVAIVASGAVSIVASGDAALVDSDDVLTYRDLWCRAEQVAEKLHAAGTRPGTTVVLALRRGSEAVVAALGVLAAGAVFAPVDPNLPPARQRLLYRRIGPGATIREGLEISPAHSGTGPEVPGAAYVIHTSGSTGAPKGVVVDRTAMAAMLGASLSRLGCTGEMVGSWSHALSFDASVWEMFGPLAAGGRVVVFSEDDVRDPARFAAGLTRHRVTHCAQTPSAFARLTDPSVLQPLAGTADVSLASLRTVILAGEAVDPARLRAWASAHPDVRLVTMYGPTETTVQVLCGDIDLDDDRPIIGTPLDGVHAEIRDRHGRAVPLGGRGELHLSGPQLAIGYLGDPATTATRFVAGPDGTRHYRTGDRVRLLPDRRIAFLGRVDDQLKIRGFRIEPAEIVAALTAAPDVLDCRVLQDGVASAARLVAAVRVGAAAQAVPTESTLISWCAQRLPTYAVPSRIVVVDDWPLTANGKIDQTELLRKLHSSSGIGRQLTPREEVVAAAIRECLDSGDDPAASAPLDPDTDLVTLGINSLTAARLAARLSLHGSRIGVTEVFSHPTIAGLAQLLSTSPIVDEDPVPDLGEVEEESTDPDHPALTPEQLDLWLRWRADPDHPGYVLAGLIPVPGTDAREIRRRVAELVRRHDCLRTGFPELDGVPYQRLWTDDEVDAYLGALDPLTGVDADEVLAEIARRPIDLTVSLPWRVRLVDTPGGYRLVCVIHHISADGETARMLRRELTTGPPTDSTRRLDYRQYSRWRQAMVRSHRDRLTGYWSRVFAEPIVPLTVTDMDLAATGSGATHRGRVRFSTELTARIDRCAAAVGSTPFIVVHTAIAVVLTRQAAAAERVMTTGGASECTVGTAVSGRTDPRWSTVCGLFARAVPLRTRIEPDDSFATLLRRNTLGVLGAIDHSDLPLAEIAAIADPERERAGRSLVDVVVGEVPPDLSVTGLDTTGLGTTGSTQAALDIMLGRDGDRTYLGAACRDSVADAGRLEALLTAITETLESGTADPALPVRALTRAPVPQPSVETPVISARMRAPQTLAELLDRQPVPDAARPAIIDVTHRFPGYGEVLCHADVERLVRILAWALRDRGLGPGDVVAKHLPRSCFDVVATMALARVGAAFVNLDPADPPRRRERLIQRSGARTILTLRADRPPRLPVRMAVVALDDSDLYRSRRVTEFEPRHRTRTLQLDDVAYLAFTSGTTGTPKGVEITHRGLAAWALTTAERLGLDATDRAMHTHSTAFDAHLMGVVPTRAAGACIVICPPEVMAGTELATEITRSAVTVLMTTPSVLSTLDPAQVARLRHVVVGGEALPRTLLSRWTSSVSVTNEYGPTETTVAISSATYRPDTTGAVSIGTPVPDIEALVLDSSLQAVPDYTVGELYVAGAALARGYLADTSTTALRFVARPFGDGDRMYRTGDLVHRRGDGSLVIHGRADDQLKIRGVRMEAEEINAALAGLPGVAAAASAVRTNRAGEPLLVSWVIPAPGDRPHPERLREQARTVLPRTMVPAAIAVVDRFPTRPSGKIDHPRLPNPVAAQEPAPGAERAGRMMPAKSVETRTELLVAEVLAEVLDCEVAEIGSDTDFFALGGTSLSAARVRSRLIARTSRDLDADVVFRARTVGELARRIGCAADLTGPIPHHAPRPEHLPLAYPQRRMWIHHRFDPEDTTYHIPLVLRIRGPYDPGRIVRAYRAVVGAHESLRTVFPDTGRGPEQRLVTDVPDLVLQSVSTAAVRDAIAAEVARPFDLERETAIRARLFVSGDDSDEDDDGDEGETGLGAAHLVLTLHHIAVDGWSMRILLDDLMTAYRAELPAESAPDYADYTRWQRDILGDPDDSTSRFTRDIAFWTTELGDADAPVVLPGPSGDSGGRVVRDVDAHVIAELREQTSALGASVFHAVHGALTATLGRLTGEWDVVVGVPVHGRSAPQWERVVGMFVNTVAVRTRLQPGATVADAVACAREAHLRAADHQEVPYESVVRAVCPNARSTHDPLTSILLVGQDVVPEPDAVVAGAGSEASGPNVAGAGSEAVRAEPVQVVPEREAAGHDLEVIVGDRDGALVLTVVYSARVSARTANEVADQLVDALVGFAGADSGLVGEETVGGTDTSESVAAAFAEIMAVDRASVRADTDFFDLGGTSLSAARVASLLTRELGWTVSAKWLFDHPTVGELVARLDRRIAEKANDGEVRVAPDTEQIATEGDDVPLTGPQRRMWMAAELGKPGYHVPVLLPVPGGAGAGSEASGPNFPGAGSEASGPNCPGAGSEASGPNYPGVVDVRKAVRTLIGRHAALRTVYPMSDDGPRQRVLDTWEPAIDLLDAGAIGDMLATPFDSLATSPPIRIGLIAPDGQAVSAVLVVAHHIALDGESAVVLQRELAAQLTGVGLPAMSRAEQISRRLLTAESAARDRELAYWHRVLADPPAPLVLDHLPHADGGIVHTRRTLPAGLWPQLDVAARSLRASRFHLVHAALAWALAVQSGTDDVVVATTTSLRRDPDLSEVVGMLVATVVLRTRLDPRMTCAEWVNRVRDDDIAALEHSWVPFDEVMREIGAAGGSVAPSLAEVALTVGADASDQTLLDPAAIGDVDESLTPMGDFALRVIVDDGMLLCAHRAQWAARATVETLMARMETALQVLVDEAETRMASVDLLVPDEQWLIEASAHGAPYTDPATLGDMFAEPATHQPERIALDDGTTQLSYRHLDDWVAVTAHALRARGIRSGARVAILIERSVRQQVAFRAVTRIGAVPVPVDVAHPPARIDAILERTGAYPLYDNDVPPRPSTSGASVTEVPVARVSPASAAYVITTSGTTGTPNAVVVGHRGLRRLATIAPIRSDDRVAAMVSLGFDPSIMEMVLPLAAAARLVVAPAEITAGAELTEWLVTQRITVFIATPSVLATVDAQQLTSVRLVFVGGEALSPSIARMWAARCELINVYGPTEATVAATFAPVRPDGTVRIGRPVDGTTVVVLDRWLRPVPPGVDGELYLAGDALAQGYLGDTALTSVRFVACPGGGRMYRTGDRARLEGDGALTYVGRTDRQIKLRGQRVEPAEIEAVLMGAGATQAAVLVRSGPVGAMLVAYVVGVGDAEVSRACRARLPRHMVPAQVIAVDEIARTVTGKIDTSRLPDPAGPSSRDRRVESCSAASDLERQVIAAFDAVLGCEPGVDDDFFALGGHSLLLLRLHAEIVDHTGLRPDLADLVAHPTPRGVAAALARVGTDRERVVDFDCAEHDSGLPLLWAVHGVSGMPTPFRPLAATSGHRVVGLQLPELLSGEMPGSMAEIARRHVDAIRRRQLSGPYRLIGWSIGGNLAHEIARQLTDLGERVELLVLMDARTPDELALAPAQEGTTADVVIAERLRALIAAVRAHRTGRVDVDEVLYVASAQTGDISGWESLVSTTPRVARLDVSHAELGEPDVMARVAQLVADRAADRGR